MYRKLLILLISHFSLVIAFSQPVTQEWVARYNSPHSSNDRFMGMVLDKYGNSYVTGWNNDSTNGNDIITVKINASGNIAWSRVYNSGGSGSVDIGEAIAVDDSGNVYVTGYTGLNFGPYNIITIKYDSTGITKWIKTYSNGEPAAIKTDKDENIYITGYSMNSAITIKYNSNGDLLWVRNYSGESGAGSNCLAMDGFGNIYIGGNVHLTNWMSLVIKYDSSGNILWANKYNNGNTNDAYSIAVDSLGNGAITGVMVFTSSSYGDYYTVRFTSTGNTLWQRYYNGTGNFDDYGQSVVVDNTGNTYVTGSSWGNDMDYFTIKYNLLGDTIWANRYDGPGNSTDNAYSICLDTMGNCYVTGSSVGLGTGDDYATIKYNPAGVQLWVVRYNGTANGGDGAGSVIVGNNNTVYVGGESDGIGTGKDLVVVKYDQLIGLINNTNQIPVNYRLYQNYPNPFNSSTVISYQLPKRSNVNLSLYNSLGQMIKEIVNGNEEAGYYSEIINLENYSSGVYFYKLVADGNIISTKKMIMIK